MLDKLPGYQSFFFSFAEIEFGGDVSGSAVPTRLRPGERRSARVTVKTWQKPETAYEKSLSPRQRTNGINSWNLSVLGRSFTESKATCNVYSNEQQHWSHFRISGPQTQKSEKPCTT